MLVEETINLDLGLLDVDSSKNPRKGRGFDEDSLEEFAARLQSEGQLTPILVRRRDKRFELVAGERRVRAARIIGWKTIRAEVLKSDVTDEQVTILTHLENLDRVNLSDYDLAVAAHELSKTQDIGGLTGYADRMGISVLKLRDHVGWIRTLPQIILDGWRDEDPRATEKNLKRLSNMLPEDAEAEWHKLAAPSLPVIEKGSKKVRKPKRPSPRQLEALMEKADSSNLEPKVKELVMQVIEYTQGARKSPPSFTGFSEPTKKKKTK